MNVVHCKKSDYTIYIGRGKCPKTNKVGIWGNPFVIGKDGTREQVVIKYKHFAVNNPDILRTIAALSEDAVLGCWCAPKDCHGNAIMEIWQELTNTT